MALFDDVRISLGYESDIDNFTTERINQCISKGKQHLRLRAPDLTDEDFSDNLTHAHSLLLDYCRYEHSGASEQFDVNYSGELLSLRQAYEVREFEKRKTD